MMLMTGKYTDNDNALEGNDDNVRDSDDGEDDKDDGPLGDNGQDGESMMVLMTLIMIMMMMTVIVKLMFADNDVHDTDSDDEECDSGVKIRLKKVILMINYNHSYHGFVKDKDEAIKIIVM